MDLNDLANLEVKLPSLFPEGDFDKVILINNAGWIGEVKTVGKLHPKGIRQALNINLLAPMILSDAFVKAYSSLEGKKTDLQYQFGCCTQALAWLGGIL